MELIFKEKEPEGTTINDIPIGGIFHHCVGTPSSYFMKTDGATGSGNIECVQLKHGKLWDFVPEAVAHLVHAKVVIYENDKDRH